MQEIMDYIGDAKVVTFDYETAPDEPYRTEEKADLNPAKSHLVGCSFSVEEHTGIYVPVAHKVGRNMDSIAFSNFCKTSSQTGIFAKSLITLLLNLQCPIIRIS